MSATALTALATSAVAAPTGTIRVTSDGSFSSQFPEGNAGEFQVTMLTDDTAALAQMDASRRAGGSYFQTFCGQFAEDIFSNTNYAWSLDTKFNGDAADPLLPTTAYLFTKFWDGTLGSYDYTPGAGRSASAKSMQLAIWYLQGQIQGNPTFLSRYNADAQAQSWVSQAQSSAGSSIGNVRVLVVQDGTLARQDLLAMVPAPKQDPCGYSELTFKYTGPDCVQIAAIDPCHIGGYYRTTISSCTSVRTGTTFTVYADNCWTSGEFEDQVKLVVKNRYGCVIECTSFDTDASPKLVAGTVRCSFTLLGFKEVFCTKTECAPKGSDCTHHGNWCGTSDGCDRGWIKECADWTYLRDCADFKDSNPNRLFRFLCCTVSTVTNLLRW